MIGGGVTTGDAWVTGLLTLIGAALGALAIVWAQKLEWKREAATRWDTSRHDAYAKFVGHATLCHDALWAIAHRRNRAGRSAAVELPWHEANARYADFVALSGAVAMLASPATDLAARALISNINDFKDEIYTKTKADYDDSDDPLGTKKKYDEEYRSVRDAFTNAARAELKITSADAL